MVKPKLYMYWEGNMRGIDNNINKWTQLNKKGFDCRFFNRTKAIQYIKNNFSMREVNAFKKCRISAMQSDYFRISMLASNLHAFYVDCNLRPRKSIIKANFFTKNKATVCFKGNLKHRRIVNAIAGNNGNLKWNKMFKKMLNIATDNIERKISNNLWLVTGPGVWNKVYKGHQAELKDDTILVNYRSKIKSNFVGIGKIHNRTHWSREQRRISIFN